MANEVKTYSLPKLEALLSGAQINVKNKEQYESSVKYQNEDLVFLTDIQKQFSDVKKQIQKWQFRPSNRNTISTETMTDPTNGTDNYIQNAIASLKHQTRDDQQKLNSILAAEKAIPIYEEAIQNRKDLENRVKGIFSGVKKIIFGDGEKWGKQNIEIVKSKIILSCGNISMSQDQALNEKINQYWEELKGNFIKWKEDNEVLNIGFRDITVQADISNINTFSRFNICEVYRVSQYINETGSMTFWAKDNFARCFHCPFPKDKLENELGVHSESAFIGDGNWYMQKDGSLRISNGTDGYIPNEPKTVGFLI